MYKMQKPRGYARLCPYSGDIYWYVGGNQYVPEVIAVEPEVTTSTGRKVPTRNPKAKPWVSPYGGKRK